MSNTPSLKAREVLEILFRAGFEKIRTSGSHIRLAKGKLRVTVPYHSKGTIPIGTLKSIIRQAGMTVPKFLSNREKK